MGFDYVDKQHQPKSSWIRLECENCGKSPDGVKSQSPKWFNGHEDVRLCPDCSLLKFPTDPVLSQQRDVALKAAGYSIVSSNMN